MLQDLSWEAVCDQAAAPVALFDLDGQYWHVNPAFCRLVGYTREEVLDRGRHDLTHPDDHVLDRVVRNEAFAAGSEGASLEKRFVRSDGRVIWVLVQLSVIRDGGGDPLMLLSQIHDITHRREVEARWRETFSHAPIGMALLDLQGSWIEVNDALCDLLGFSRAELLDMGVRDLIYPDEDDQREAILRPLVAGEIDTVTLEQRYRHKDGHPLWVLIRVTVVRGPDERPAYVISQYEEIGDRRMADTHLAHMALHDPLTGLANRALLTERLADKLVQLQNRERVVVVLMVDLDGLKPVNDHYGHLTGDQLLLAAADKLLGAVRTGDTVARLGGDEFVVASHVADAAAAEALRERVEHHLDTEIDVPGHRIALRASVGLAVTELPETSTEVLLHSADRDMYERKWQRRPEVRGRGEPGMARG